MRLNATASAPSAGIFIAVATMHPPEAIPALRPVEPASPGSPLAAITDGLVEATHTLDSVLRTHLPPIVE